MKYLSRLSSSAARWSESTPATPWTRADDEAARLEAAAAQALAKKLSLSLMNKTEKSTPPPPAPLAIEEGLFTISFNPPRFYVNKKGEKKEQKMPIRFLRVTAGRHEFKIMAKTDPARVLAHRDNIARRCGAAAGVEFMDAVNKFMDAAPSPVPLGPSLPPRKPDFTTPASYVTVRTPAAGHDGWSPFTR